MKSFRFVAHVVVAIILAVVATTIGCSNSQPLTPSQSTAAAQSGRSGFVSASKPGEESLSADTLAELARARNATAKYHDVAVAVADGYVQKVYGSGEGYHFVNAGLMDCTFDLEHPEVLLYTPSGEGLRLVGVEYIRSDPSRQPRPKVSRATPMNGRGPTRKAAPCGP